MGERKGEERRGKGGEYKKSMYVKLYALSKK